MSEVLSLDDARDRRRRQERNPKILTQEEAEADWCWVAEWNVTILSESELRKGAARGDWFGRGCPCLSEDPDPTCPIVGHFYGDADEC